MPHCLTCKHCENTNREFARHYLVRKYNKVAYKGDGDILQTHATLGYVCGRKAYRSCQDLDPIWHRCTYVVVSDLSVLNYWEECPHYKTPNWFDNLKLKYVTWMDKKEKKNDKSRGYGTDDPGPR